MSVHIRDEPLVDPDVERTGRGQYRADVTDRWLALGGAVNGGYLGALTLRALAVEAPLAHPLVVSSFFLRRAAAGPAHISVSPTRSGARHFTARAVLTQHDEPVVTTEATFVDRHARHGRTDSLRERPDLPAPDDCIDPRVGDALPDVTIAQRVDFRFGALPGWWQGAPTGDPTTTFWMRFADGRATDVLDLPLLVDAAAPAVLELGVLGSSTLQLTTHVQRHPVPGWLACRATTRTIFDGYHEEDFEIWDDDGLVALSRQLALLPNEVTP